MTLDWTSIFVQIPVVAAFIYFASANQKNFLSALDARDKAYEERNRALIDAIQALTKQLALLTEKTAEHDSWTHEAVSLMVENAEKRSVTKRNQGPPK